MVIVCKSGMSHFTIGTFLKNKGVEAIKASASLKTMRLIKIQEGPTSDMGKHLTAWIEDKTKKCISLSTMTITTKVTKFVKQC